MHTRRSMVLRETATLAPHAAVLGLMLVLAARGDAMPVELLLAVGAVLVFHVIPGLLLWRAVRPVDGWLVEDLAMGFALGAALSVPTQVLTVATGLGVLPFVVPVLVSALLLGVPATRTRIASRQVLPLPWWWGSAVAASLLAPALAFVDALSFPLRWTGFAERYVDLPFHEALVGELLHRFPLHYPHVANEEVAYHWFGHAWSANIVALSGTPIDITLWRVDPALIHVVAPLLTAVVAMRITRHHLAGPIAAAVAFFAPTVQPWQIEAVTSPLTVASPTQGFGVLLLPALIAVLAMRWRSELPRLAGLTLMVFLMVIAGGAKGTTLAILLPGLLLACVAMLVFDRRRLARTAADTVIAGLVLLGLAQTLFAGGGDSLSVVILSDWIGSRGERLQVTDASPWTAVGAAILLILLLKYLLVVLGLFAALTARIGRQDPLLWTLLGSALAGIGAMAVFTHPGGAQYYFFKTSLVPLGIGAGCGIAAFSRSARRPSAAMLAGAVAGCAGFIASLALVGAVSDGRATLGSAWASVATLVVVVAAVATALWSRLGRAAAVLCAATAMIAAAAVPAVHGLIDFRPQERQVSRTWTDRAWVPASNVRALRWLRDHSDPDDLIATNQHCVRRTRPDCSHRAFTIAAYTERRVLVEGWAYVPRATALYDPENGITTSNMPFWEPELLALNDGFFEHPDQKGAEAMRELGVRWLVVVKMAPHAETLEPFARLRHESRHIDVYELPTEQR